MTEFKYGSSNYNKKLSTTDRAGTAATAANSNLVTAANKPASIDESGRRPHPRLKKSFSECEYYENGPEVNFNLSPSKSKSKKRVRLEPTSTNLEPISTDVGSAGGGKLQYNYDTLKSQYLLQQQQKLKEYKLDPNYLTNGDNYSSESSTETRGILKNTKTSPAEAHNKNSLKRNKGLSTLSLCSCDAETEVTMMANRSIYPPFSPH